MKDLLELLEFLAEHDEATQRFGEFLLMAETDNDAVAEDDERCPLVDGKRFLRDEHVNPIDER